ncbi:MAG: DegT/DnrJ/EryC1/StrS family aminotransferase [Acidobacteria bacterium]|nr:DegT/DnrJ/EryC1/StrS family aminotransferase [Acidobacteriota bacterium]MCB9396322.1 DegT/DnrJ/EryC1/StrS family aminotransferase [Acidobacteriota bacterium]
MAAFQVPYVDIAAQNQQLKAAMLEAVARVIDSGQLILGPEVAELEQELAEALAVPFVVGVNSGTDALILALRLHGIGPGDEVITVSHSFFATAAAICLVGAKPVYVDLDPATMLMDPGQLASARTARTRAVLPVHLNGWVCDMEPIVAFCQRHDLILIEDVAQAMGSFWMGRAAGSFGTGAFSLHPLKVLSALGDAGFLSVHSEAHAEQVRQMRNLGLVDRDHCAWISGNSRLDSVQAAMLRVKLQHYQAWIQTRNAYAALYRRGLAGKVELPPDDPRCETNYAAFVIRHPDRDRLQVHLAQKGVSTKVHYPVPIHRQQPYAKFQSNPLPMTEQVVSTCLSLPIHQTLSPEQIDYVISCIYSYLN